MNLKATALLLGLFTSSACADDHTPMSFAVEGQRIVANGEIDGQTLDAFEEVVEQNPGVRTLVLNHVGGSVDDEANVVFSRIVRDLGFKTVVPSNGLIASGGTDLFLAGEQRILEKGACVGVHSWAAGDFTATDLPRSDAEHDRYISYYEDIGIDPEFYWFTIEAAPANGMHWMNAQDVTRYGVVTTDAPVMGTSQECDAR